MTKNIGKNMENSIPYSLWVERCTNTVTIENVWKKIKLKIQLSHDPGIPFFDT